MCVKHFSKCSFNPHNSFEVGTLLFLFDRWGNLSTAKWFSQGHTSSWPRVWPTPPRKFDYWAFSLNSPTTLPILSRFRECQPRQAGCLFSRLNYHSCIVTRLTFQMRYIKRKLMWNHERVFLSFCNPINPIARHLNNYNYYVQQLGFIFPILVYIGLCWIQNTIDGPYWI